METYAGILTIIVVVIAVAYFVRRRNAWHDAHPKDEGSAGTGNKDGGKKAPH